MSKPRVAILGLGIMGGGMANRLLSSGFPVAVYNRNPAKAAPFASAVWLGENGALVGAARGSVLIESSTLTVGWIKELSAAAAQRGFEFLDAPVTGTKPHAASGELLFLVGGSASALAMAQPVFSVLGRETVYLGPTGSGALLKLINNFMCGVQAASFAEAVSLIEAGGLDRAKAEAILTSGAPGSGIVKRAAASAAANDFTPNFPLRLMAKDLGYAIDEASHRGLQLQTASSALAVFKQAIVKGHGDEDFSAVVKATQQK